MKCRRLGCPNNTKKTGSFVVHVFDERKQMPQSGDYMGTKNAPEYEGHDETWCRDCVRQLEPHKYTLIYFVSDRKVKLKRVKRKKPDKELAAAIPEPIAPIVESDFVETIP